MTPHCFTPVDTLKLSEYVKWSGCSQSVMNLLDLPVLLSLCVAFMTDFNVGQIISKTNSLVSVQFYMISCII